MKKHGDIYSVFKAITLILVFFIGCFILFQSILSSYRLIQKKNNVHQEEQRLQQAESMRDALKNDIARSQTETFIEQEARNKLGLIRSGEQIIYLRDEQQATMSNSEREKPSDQQDISPIRQWMKVFFGR